MLRDAFPCLKSYAYLNAAASSPLAQPVADAAIAQIRESVESGDVGFTRWLALREKLRARCAGLINALPSQVAFTASTSAGFHLVAELLRRRGIVEVVTLEGEFPSTTIPFLNLGFRLKVVKPGPDGVYRVDDIERAIGPQTGAVAASVVQFASGFTVDLGQLSQLCRTRRLPLALNAAQALGQVPVDVLKADADFLCATSHKWLMGGYGTGIFYVRPGWLEQHGLPWAGWLSPPAEQRWQTFAGAAEADGAVSGVATSKSAAALEAGGGNWWSLSALDAALTLIEGVGIEAIHRHNLALQARLREGLQARGFRPNAPLCSGICVVPVADPAAAARSLLLDRVVVSPRRGLRFSTHAFNDESDVDRALAALDQRQIAPA